MTEAGWTRDKPTVAGWYWWRLDDGQMQVVYVSAGGTVSISGVGKRSLKRLDGEWLGPLSPTDRQQGRVEGLREAAGMVEVVKAADAQATIAALEETILKMGENAAVVAKDAMAAKEQVAALQARVKELEARQHFGACAKCLTNAWRICKEGTPDAVEMKCSNGSTWWLCDYCLSKEQLTQRTAELEAVKADTKNMLDVATSRLREQVADLQAELERVRGELAHAKKMEAVQKEVADNQTWHVQKLRTLIAALPKVEGEIVIDRKGNGTEAGRLYAYVSTQTESYYRLHAARFTENEHADAYAALLQHRQGME